MGVRSQGGVSNGENYVPAIFRDIFGRTGTDATTPEGANKGLTASACQNFINLSETSNYC